MQYVLLCFIIQYCWTLCILNCNSDTYIKQRKLKFRQAYKWYLIIMKHLHIKTFIIFSAQCPHIFKPLHYLSLICGPTWMWSPRPSAAGRPPPRRRAAACPGPSCWRSTSHCPCATPWTGTWQYVLYEYNSLSQLCVLFLVLSMYSFLMSVLCFMYDVRSSYSRGH